MTMLTIDPQSGTPIYLQLMSQIRHAIAMGVFLPGDALPTIRELALQLRVNPNTVAKAIRELEREGVLVTRVGKGSFVSDAAPAQAERDRKDKGKSLASQFGQDMHWLGYDCPSAVKLVEETWEESNHRHD
ncbi:MAG: GntR family transcriptional regulator [Candidatus Melainabacteria bacterium HGW-Melainabacteria-1]|nr:MAG: GntR family transcriptional regulator [Candidatus Melainabacteria bacterium HGW-Melainabacteria-1]